MSDTILPFMLGMIAFVVVIVGATKSLDKHGPCFGKRCGT